MTPAATATATAWTEAEIREAITESVGEGYAGVDDTVDMLDVLIDCDMARVRGRWDSSFHPSERHPGTLWADLRPAEWEELEDAVLEAHRSTEADATAMLIERLTAVALAFQEAHPDIPRGHWPLRGTEAAP